MTGTSPTARFSSRVSHYTRARPDYPPALLQFLRESLGLIPSHLVADIGSGTGILTRRLLEIGNTVFAIEPNPDMRQAAEQAFRNEPGFRSVNATAEATTLAPQSIDLITVAQAFHWFEPSKTRAEFQRILKSAAGVALIWNDRRTDASPFAEAYERFIQQHNREPESLHCKSVTRQNEHVLSGFFAPLGFEKIIFPNSQGLDYAGLEARVLSSSYMPMQDDPRYPAMVSAMQRLFDDHQRAGQVVIEYDTVVYHGRLK